MLALCGEVESECLHSLILCVGRRIYCLRLVLLHICLGWGQSFISVCEGENQSLHKLIQCEVRYVCGKGR